LVKKVQKREADMRIFGSKRITKTSGYRATNVATHSASVARAAAMPLMPVTPVSPVAHAEHAEQVEPAPIRALEVTDEMPIVESRRPGTSPGTADEEGNSDVFVCRRSSPDHSAEAAAAAAGVDAAVAECVTLFVYGWESVEPGPLSWPFPSLRAALDAVKTMRNAVEWCIVAGSEYVSVDAARAKGAVLIEQHQNA
jgi:hypothetical protein